MRGLLLQPYDTGSHRAWADGYLRHSEVDWRALRLPGRFWKWRMHGAAVTFAERLGADGQTPDVVLTTDMLDVATWRGLAPWPAHPPLVLYMHENQLAYPTAAIDADWTPSRQRRAARPDVHYAWLNLTAALAADAVAWNSAHNRDTFLDAVPAFLRQFPDAVPDHVPHTIAAKSTVLPLGLDLWPTAPRSHDDAVRPPRLVWNHRWEHDKDPEAFVALLSRLVALGLPFDVTLLGETFGRAHPARRLAVNVLGDRLAHDGFVADVQAYRAELARADVVVSTARHEFFGASVCEAVWAGAWPVLPHGLGYGEWLPASLRSEVIHHDADALLALTVRALQAAATPRNRALRRQTHAALRDAIAPLAWPVMAPRYDALLADTVRTARAAGSGAADVRRALPAMGRCP